MKKIIFPLLLSSFLFSGFNVTAQWLVGGNALAAPGTFGSTSAQPVVFFSSGTERGRLHANGNWAFGTFGGVDKVQINTAAGQNAFRANVAGTTKLLVHSGGGVSIGSGSTPPANGLYVATSIGVGIAAPAFTLDVRSASVFGQFKSSSGYAGVILDKAAANQNGYVIYRTAGTDRWTVGTIGSDNFSLHNPGNGGDALTIDITNNNVGIGAIASGAKLNVVGSTSAGNGINVSGYSYGLAASTDLGVAVLGSSNNLAVYGYAPNGSYGTFGYSNYIGAYGSGTTYGVSGSGGTYGVYGVGPIGLYASSNTTSGDGVHSNVSGSANYGVNSYSANSIGVYGATGSSSSYAGFFAGNVYTTGSYLPSDAKLKKNITSVDNAMDIINRLLPKNYEYRNDGNFEKMNLPNGQHYGFIVQDLEKILPNLVKETSFDVAKTVQPAEAPSIALPVNGTTPARPQQIQPVKETKEEKIDFKAINYIELIPIVVKGMQEQNIKIQEQKLEMQKQEAELTNLKSEINELKTIILKNANGSTVTALAGYLKQNTPNPIGENTVIKYFAPNDTRNAQIQVTDMKGSVLKTYKVTNGEGQLTIRSGELPSGTYKYTLYVNNSKIDTKQMIIAR